MLLTRNLNVPAGLVNGALGEVYDILYHEPPPSPPYCVLVIFPTYAGPQMMFDDAFTHPPPPEILAKLVPIAPMTTLLPKTTVQRTQVPLKLAFSMTVHKAQGITADKVHVHLDISSMRRNPQLFFVAITRVRAIADIAIEPVPLSSINCARYVSLAVRYVIVFLKNWVRIANTKACLTV